MQTESRTFEFSEGTSDKFWTIALSGSSHTVRFGRKGTSGQEQTKTLATEDAARSSYEKLIAEKLKKGYHEVGDAPVAAETAPPKTAAPNQLAGTWTRIDKWLKKSAPPALATLQQPATAQQIADLEKDLGMPLPADLLASLQIHNGQTNPRKWIGLMNGWRLMACAQIANWSKGMARMLESGEFSDNHPEGDGAVKSDWWNKRWVPFLEGGDGNCLCVDMDPDEGGQQGQVIVYWHDEDDRKVEANSLASFLSAFADDLENGDYGVTDNGGLEN